MVSVAVLLAIICLNHVINSSKKESLEIEMIDAIDKEYIVLGTNKDFIVAIKTNPLATKVKLVALRHNSNLKKLDIFDEQNL